MSAALQACRDHYARCSTPETLSSNHFAEAIMGAGDVVPAQDPHGDAMALADTLSDGLWDLASEAPEDGWEWTDETRSDVDQAIALMLQSLKVIDQAIERERPRFREWDKRTMRELAARSNVVSILGRRARP